jgi:hypothetical protein
LIFEQSGSFRQSLPTPWQGPLDACAQLLQWLQFPVSQTLLTPLEVLDELVELEPVGVLDELVVEPLDEPPSPELPAVPPWPVVPAPLPPVPPIDPPLPMSPGLDPTAHDSGIANAKPAHAIRNARCKRRVCGMEAPGIERGDEAAHQVPGGRHPGRDADISHARLHLDSSLLAYMPDRAQRTR